ncbi:MAG TPA: NAD(P)-dependent oxidoreductase, partial [Candidatus Omnitrophota bacterium]|nr:NAD(P)-dependent oxidoreductase [Candidatus Omnitrophota bacterium]
MTKIAITTSSFAKDKHDVLKMLPADCEVIMNPYGRTLKPDELVQLAGEAIGIIAGTEKYDATTLSQLKNLKVISRVGVGIDGIDLAVAKERGIKVLNTPNGPTQAVAELVLGLMLSLLRKTHLMDRELRQGNWKKEMGNLLCSKAVGIVGLGRIGRKVAELVSAFGAKVGYS